mgnify:CR=1 FL=1
MIPLVKMNVWPILLPRMIELEKIMLVNGTEPRCGVINHYGWYEDAGYKDMKELAGSRRAHLYLL